ncbi:PF09836 family protein [Bacteriovorax sp. BAL6_X]|uniref:HvfC/BufC N-terminal domain-containing protein n=1 Tax=Bacteriovorax sp. BAL6_X TaxID=1201290 RepID=UPI00038646B9|nr:DNA-binding domain-containing protein [Bacteriovorax sp. BAL6_X]EPZ50179.1 PF09836 family protein [Bacteriovorax sp. BAL6_X]
MNHDEFQNKFLKGVIAKDISEDIMTEMIPIGELSNEQVLEVYQNDYRARLQEVIGDNYETCWFVLGDEDFLDISLSYVESRPSEFTNLLHYGDDFPDFITSRVKEFSFIKDLAEFEKTFWHLFHQEDNSKAFNPQELGEGIFETPLELKGTFALFSSDVQLSQLWQMRKGDSNKSFDDIQGNELVILYKKEEKMQIQIISEGIFELISNLRSHETIISAVEDIEEEKLSDPSLWSVFFNLLGYIAEVKSK